MKRKTFPFRREYLDQLMKIPNDDFGNKVLRESLQVLCSFCFDGYYNKSISFETADVLEEIVPNIVHHVINYQAKDKEMGRYLLFHEEKFKQVQLLQENGQYGHLGKAFGHLGAEFGKLGGRPRKNNPPSKTPLPENQEPPLETPASTTDDEIKEGIKIAIQRAAMGYSVPILQSNNATIVKHVPINIAAAKIVLDPDYVPAKDV